MGTATKAKRLESPRAARPDLARADSIDKATRARLEAEIDAALKRRPTSESKLGGALRALCPHSAALRGHVHDALEVLVRRRSFDRELYSACVRSLGECGDKRAPVAVKSALASDDAGGAATFAAACALPRDAAADLGPLLGKIAASRQSHLAFSAEVARVVRKESNGSLLKQLAPMIKEAHRISLCVDLLLPLVRRAPVPVAIAPALEVLRSAERHLGRWLVMAEVAVRAGDRAPLDEARTKSTSGPQSSRGAWGLVAWALEQSQREAAVDRSPPVSGDAATNTCPDVRPTVELIARLSDRPSANRDMTFLFRMADARVAHARAMLETMVRGGQLTDENGVRAALYLARDHGRGDLEGSLAEVATASRREELRGLAAAALWDLGRHDRAREITDDLVASKTLSNVAWGALVRAAGARPHPSAVLTEPNVRFVQWGWLE